jgi:PEP-CTERM motif
MPRELRCLAAILHVNKLEVCGWGCILRISRWVAILAFAGAILAFVGLSSSTALADAITDPGVKLKPPPGGSTPLFTPDDPNFTLNVAAGPSTIPQLFDFINEIGRTAIGVNLNLISENGSSSGSFNLLFTCDNSADPYFTTCSPGLTPTKTTLISFFGLDPEASKNGIPSCIGESCSGTAADFEFAVINDTASPFILRGHLLVPEPSTVLLLLVGVGFLFLFRRAGWVPKLT